MHANDRFSVAVKEMLRQYVPDIKGSRVTVALSGGADSVALCHFLASNAAALEITVAAAHLNHALRGKESDADEAFVREFCIGLGVPLVCERLAPDGQHPSEAHLRQRRYEFLWRAAGDGFLATAHTLTDSCETLLLHLARGTRLGGLRGIAARQEKLIRPMLELTRADVEEYCVRQKLTWVQDSSNASLLYARNRVRHGAMPALRSVNPEAEAAMGALMQEAGELYAYLSEQAQTLLERAALEPLSRESGTQVWDASLLAAAPDVVLRHMLAQLLAPYGDCSAARIALAVACIRSGGAVEWCAGVRLRCENGRVFIECGTKELPSAPDFCVPLQEGIYHCAPGVTVQIRLIKREEAHDAASAESDKGEFDEKSLKIHKKDLNNRLDYDRITSILSASKPESPAFDESVAQLRFRRAGDRFSPGRGRGDKSLKKWFNEISCPPVQRGRLPLIAVGSRVVWLADSGAAEGFAATEESHTVWEVRWHLENREGSYDDGNGKRDAESTGL